MCYEWATLGEYQVFEAWFGPEKARWFQLVESPLLIVYFGILLRNFPREHFGEIGEYVSLMGSQDKLGRSPFFLPRRF